MSDGGFRFENPGRNQKTVLILGAVYAGLLWLTFGLDASPWITGALALCTLPAIWDIWADRLAGMEVTDAAVRWFSGRRAAEIAIDEIDHVRLDTRLDFSVRASIVTKADKRVRLPYEATPPHKALETELSDRGITVKRHYFSLM